MKICTIFRLIKNELDVSFVEKFIERVHADPDIKQILGISDEIINETKCRVLASLKLSKI
jgi:hypothetical protein